VVLLTIGLALGRIGRSAKHADLPPEPFPPQAPRPVAPAGVPMYPAGAPVTPPAAPVVAPVTAVPPTAPVVAPMTGAPPAAPGPR
jgi:hypothetical protein